MITGSPDLAEASLLNTPGAPCQSRCPARIEFPRSPGRGLYSNHPISPARFGTSIEPSFVRPTATTGASTPIDGIAMYRGNSRWSIVLALAVLDHVLIPGTGVGAGALAVWVAGAFRDQGRPFRTTSTLPAPRSAARPADPPIRARRVRLSSHRDGGGVGVVCWSVIAMDGPRRMTPCG